jgi:hypothetical protein
MRFSDVDAGVLIIHPQWEESPDNIGAEHRLLSTILEPGFSLSPVRISIAFCYSVFAIIRSGHVTSEKKSSWPSPFAWKAA